MIEYKIITEEDEWNEALLEFKNKDIFFEYNYFHLYEEKGKKPMMVYMNSHIGRVAYPFMLKDIAFHPSLSQKIEKNTFFDISSPYGYSGPLVEAYKKEERTELIELFYEKFEKFCKDNKVVSEFIKFSPILKNHENMDSVLQTVYLKKMLATNLETQENIDAEIRKSRKKSIRKTRKFGFETEIIVAPKSLDEQMKIYYDTMDRKDATEAFLFSKAYFEKILNTLSEKLLIVNIKNEGKLVAFGLRFLSGDTIYAHLAGTLREYLECSPTNISYADTITWGHENGYKYLFIGGGLTNSEEDSLYEFKRTFSQKTDFDFYIGKKVWNQRDYDYLVTLASDTAIENKGFFPQYREY